MTRSHSTELDSTDQLMQTLDQPPVRPTIPLPPPGPGLVSEASPCLVVLAGPHTGQRFAVGDSTAIGRAAHADVRLAHDGVSRLHARIRRLEGGEFAIEDLGSRNGTLLNGVPVAHEQLKFGDWIQVGAGVMLLFTAQQPLEEHLLQAKKMEAVGRLSAGITHDLGNLLTVLVGCTAGLRALPASAALEHTEVNEYLADIETATKRAVELTVRLAGFARGQDPTSNQVDLSALSEEVVHLMQRTLPRSIRVESDIEPRLWIDGNRAALYQLLLNPCLNARDAMPRGGMLSVKARRVKTSELRARPLIATEHCVVLSIEDTGMGMDEQTRARALEPFFTTKSEGAGTGLGLATVHKVAREHGGHVQIESALWRGTSIKIVLPCAVSQSRRQPEKVTCAESRVLLRPDEDSRALVLLVEDEEIVARSVGKTLQRLGHDVLYAEDGLEALSVYQQSPKPDLVLLDVDMPRMGGEECFRELQQFDPKIKAVFVSGNSDQALEHSLIKQGAAAFLRKPLDLETLRLVIASTLEQGAPANQAPAAQQRKGSALNHE